MVPGLTHFICFFINSFFDSLLYGYSIMHFTFFLHIFFLHIYYIVKVKDTIRKFNACGLWNKNKPKREETCNLICAPNEDSNQPMHSRSLISTVFVRKKKTSHPWLSKWRPVKRTLIRLHRLFWTLAGRICRKVSFLTLRLKFWWMVTITCNWFYLF